MRKVMVYNNVSLDGYFVDAKDDMRWAHKRDPEWSAFVRAGRCAASLPVSMSTVRCPPPGARFR